MLIIAQVLKEKWLKTTRFAHSQTTNKLVNEAANNSAQVSGQDHKKLPTLRTNQIAGFGGFRPLARLKKNKQLSIQKIELSHIPDYQIQNSVDQLKHPSLKAALASTR